MSFADTPKDSDMATASSFSYAQAAKGQGSVSSSTPSNQTSQATPSQTEPSTPHDAATAESVHESSATTRSSEARSTTDTKETESIAGSESATKSSREKAANSPRDESVSRLDRPWRRNDRSTRSSSTGTRDETENRRRKGKKARNSEKQSNEQSTEKSPEKEPEAQKIEYSEAPPPAVNPWLKRKEGLSTKAPAPTTNSSEQASDDLPGQLTELKLVQATEPASVPTSNGGKTQRKVVDSQKPERNNSRGNRDTKTVMPPPVNDSMAWPTPETAVTEEKKKAPTDRPEPVSKDKESDDGQPKLKQKKEWVTYDYVPSVSFETQLPQMRNSKSRGSARSTNGSRANSSQTGDKPSGPSTSKAGETKERPRENANGSAEPAITPAPASKRASVDVAALKEQKKPVISTNVEKPKDSTVAQPSEPTQPPRERPEGRSDRGRGGYRGRGGHNPVNNHNHGASMNSITFTPNGSVSRPHGHYSPPPRSGGHGQMYTPQRGGRGARNGNNNSFHRLSMPNGRLPQVQTQFSGYEYPVAPMTAVPFQPQPYWDGMIAATLKHQVEYYFSVENLCKDVFLRKRMDSQGFVPLQFIAGFRRVRDLSTDFNLLRAVCEDSADIDLVIGEDDGERLRRRHGWENWVMPVEDRDELARSSGPRSLNFRNRVYGFGQAAMNGLQPMQFPMPSPSAFSAQGEAGFQQYAEQGPNGLITNGHPMPHVNGISGSTQLSAEVPDFSPSNAGFGKAAKGDAAPALNGALALNGMVNGAHGEEAT